MRETQARLAAPAQRNRFLDLIGFGALIAGASFCDLLRSTRPPRDTGAVPARCVAWPSGCVRASEHRLARRSSATPHAVTSPAAILPLGCAFACISVPLRPTYDPRSS